MRSIIFTALTCGSLLILPACATMPDPVEVCSAQWIAPRAERAMSDFKRDTRSIFKKLRKTGDTLQDGGTIGALQMFSLLSSLNALENKLKNGRAIRDMRMLATTCDDPELLKNAINDFMLEQGISERFIQFLNGFDAYTKLLKTGETPI